MGDRLAEIMPKLKILCAYDEPEPVTDAATTVPASDVRLLIAEGEKLRAEIQRRDTYTGCDGCSTGDCPHGDVNDCVQAQAESFREMAAEEALHTQQVGRLEAAMAEVERLLKRHCSYDGCRENTKAALAVIRTAAQQVAEQREAGSKPKMEWDQETLERVRTGTGHGEVGSREPPAIVIEKAIGHTFGLGYAAPESSGSASRTSGDNS